jgi:hypothetical protein
MYGIVSCHVCYNNMNEGVASGQKKEDMKVANWAKEALQATANGNQSEHVEHQMQDWCMEHHWCIWPVNCKTSSEMFSTLKLAWILDANFFGVRNEQQE